MSADVRTARCGECGHPNDTAHAHCERCGAPLARGDGARWGVFGVATPFVGRTVELDAVMDAVAAAAASGAPRWVSVVGAEGFGKTRLLDAVNALLVQRYPSALMPRARRCQGDHRRAAFEDLLRDRFYASGNSADAARRIEGGARSLVAGERAEAIASLLVRGLGLASSSASAPRDESWDAALREIVLADARREPLVLAFDDLDTSDEAAWHTLAGLLRGVDAPWVLLTTSTSDDALRGALAPAAPSAVRMELGPLDDESVDAIVLSLFSRAATVPPLLLARVREAAAGSPLVTEESVRLLIRQGVVATRGNVWTVDEVRLQSASLPSGVEAAVRALLPQLTDAERVLLQDAALIGDTFWLSGLVVLERGRGAGADAGATHDDPSDIGGRLEALVRRGLIREHALSALRGDREYAFKHRAQRRIFLESAGTGDAASAHVRLAQWLQVRSVDDPERFLASIAEHYERGGVFDRASEFLVRAARVSRDRHAPERAVGYLERALDRVRDDDMVSRGTILDELGGLYLVLGRHRDANAVNEAAAALARTLCAERRQAAALGRWGRGLVAVGEFDEALDVLRRAERMHERLDDLAGLAVVLDEAGKVFWVRGQLDEAETHFRRALELRRSVGDPLALARSNANIGRLLLHRGLFRAAHEQFKEALSLRRDAGDVEGVVEALNALGAVSLERGDHEAAVRLWTEAVAIARESQLFGVEAALLNNLGEAQLALNRLDAAAEHLDAAVARACAAGDRRVEFDARRNLGTLAARRGDVRRAVELGDESLALARSLRSPVLEGIALRTLGEIHGQTAFDDSGAGPAAVAEAAFRSSLELLREQGIDVEVGKTHHAYGTFLVEQRQLLLGRKHLELARDIFARLELRRVLARTEETIASI